MNPPSAQGLYNGSTVSTIISKVYIPYLEIGGRSKPLLTRSKVTAERLLVCVYEHMLLQVTALIEGFRAMVALEGFLPSVSGHMAL